MPGATVESSTYVDAYPSRAAQVIYSGSNVFVRVLLGRTEETRREVGDQRVDASIEIHLDGTF